MKIVALQDYIPAQDSALGQFLRFGVVGTIGFIVDSSVLQLVAVPLLRLIDQGRHAELSYLYAGRVFSFLVAATCTWALNRRFTFRQTFEHPVRQWVRFLGANGVGFVANYGTYAVVVTLVPTAEAHPTIGVAAGAIAGLVFNFTINKFWVFRAKPR